MAAVAGNTAGGLLHAVQRNRFFRGETLSVLELGKRRMQLPCRSFTMRRPPLESAPHPMMQVRLRCEHPIAPALFYAGKEKQKGRPIE